MFDACVLLQVDSEPFDVRFKNDHKPVFDSNTLSEVSVPENVTVNHVLTTFVATDQDIGAQSVVKYSLQTNEGFVSIHPTSGVLSIAKVLDRETTSEIVVTVIATDSAPSPFEYSTNHTFTVKVTDINDNAPTFSSVNIHKSVLESTNIGEIGATIVATDPDEGANGEVTYTVLSANDTIGFFVLDTQSGSFKVQSKTFY